MSIRYKRWAYSPKQAAKGSPLPHMVVDHGDGTPELTLCNLASAGFVTLAVDSPASELACRTCRGRLPERARNTGLLAMLAYVQGLERTVPQATIGHSHLPAKEEALRKLLSGRRCDVQTKVLTEIANGAALTLKEARAGTWTPNEEALERFVDLLGRLGYGPAADPNTVPLSPCEAHLLADEAGPLMYRRQGA